MPPEILHNYWLWAFLVTGPAIVFVGWRMREPTRAKVLATIAIRMLVATIVGYVLLNLAVHRYWDLRVAYLPAGATDEQSIDATADGANLVFTMLLGWIPAGMYAGVGVLVRVGVWLITARREPRPPVQSGSSRLGGSLALPVRPPRAG